MPDVTIEDVPLGNIISIILELIEDNYLIICPKCKNIHRKVNICPDCGEDQSTNISI